MEEVSLEQAAEKPQKKRRSRGFGDSLEVEIETEEVVLEKEAEIVEEPVAEAPKEAAPVRHHETLVRPLTRTKPVPKRGMKAAVRVRP